MFESDCWLDWDPDPERAARDADPKLEPYASMSKAQVLELMTLAKGGREWEFLQEYFLNKCTAAELAVGAEEFIKTHYSAFGFEELCILEDAIGLALRRRANLDATTDRPGAGSNAGGYSFTITDRFTPITPVPIADKAG